MYYQGRESYFLKVTTATCYRVKKVNSYRYLKSNDSLFFPLLFYNTKTRSRLNKKTFVISFIKILISVTHFYLKLAKSSKN